MSTPAKNRFMNSIMEDTNKLESNCLRLAQDVNKFNVVHLTHSMSIIMGMVQSVRKYLIVNNVDLKKSLPKGVKRHGEEIRNKQKRAAAHKS